MFVEVVMGLLTAAILCMVVSDWLMRLSRRYDKAVESTNPAQRGGRGRLGRFDALGSHLGRHSYRNHVDQHGLCPAQVPGCEPVADPPGGN